MFYVIDPLWGITRSTVDSLTTGKKYAWWRHQMETFSALLALCAENSSVPVNSPHKGQWRGTLMFSLICAWINNWVNNRKARYLRRNRTHYDVTVMWTSSWSSLAISNYLLLLSMYITDNIHTLIQYPIRYVYNFVVVLWLQDHMMTSSNGNIFRITGLLCGEFTDLRWIPRTKASNADLWYFLWSAPNWTVE